MTHEQELSAYQERIEKDRADRRINERRTNGPRLESNGRRSYDLKKASGPFDFSVLIQVAALIMLGVVLFLV